MQNSTRQDIKPSIWGPYFWATLHSIPDGAPFEPTDQERSELLNVLKALLHILPCEKCRLHVSHHILENEPMYLNREELRIWIWELHNKVNATLAKPTEPFECCLKSYKSIKSTNKYAILGCLTLAILAMIIIAHAVKVDASQRLL